ncbi:hypothetical protein QBC34DRAFT_310923 [Podospora aff. communis PSN243]|uniref:Protein kinase domain-containing protein n=1 Tax=Podospora aff. communis PSN243 TaxID=3040156 RepID=A0AAV9G4K4_9PEZI|nr:hypothetical protein QBC34DRAFT_310923 [Podospora aff. communis PSN243]
MRFGPTWGRVLYFDENPQVWFDYDTRRAFVVETGATASTRVAPGGVILPPSPIEELEQEEEILTHKWFQEHPDELGPGVTAILLEDGQLVSTSDNDGASGEVLRHQVFPRYPTLAEAGLPGHAKTILRAELVELDRLGRNVDKVSFADTNGNSEEGKLDKSSETTAAFKYFTDIFRSRHHWVEHKLLMLLPPHPLLLRYVRTVLDGNPGRVVGFCAEYFAGKSLETYPVVLNLSWVKQLTRLLDDLNLTCGFAHGGIWAGNLMVNEATDEVKLIDFESARPIELDPLIDVRRFVATIYTIITGKSLEPQKGNKCRDAHLEPFWPEIPSWDWPQLKDTKLDHDVNEFQRLLEDWVATRRELAEGEPARKRQKKSAAPQKYESAKVPETQWPSRAKVQEALRYDRAVCYPPYNQYVRSRGTTESPWVSWERPATKDLVPGVAMLANGKPAGKQPVAMVQTDAESV